MEALIQEHFKIILSRRQYGTYIKWNIHRFTDLSTAKAKVMSLTSQVFKQSKDTFLYPQMKECIDRIYFMQITYLISLTFLYNNYIIWVSQCDPNRKRKN